MCLFLRRCRILYRVTKVKNIFKRIFTINIVALLLVVALAGNALAAAPTISADAAIVVDLATGDTLYEKNADKREYPASTTKVMTCLLALESNRTNRIVQVSANAADVESTWLGGGERVRLADLLTQMMLVSDNGAATAVGESLAGGDIDYFALMMNRRAAELGATATHFVNANGMPDANHYTTARDLAKIGRAAFAREDFRSIVARSTANVYYIEPAKKCFWETTNELLTTYPGCIGGKTGWTNAARGCLMVAAARDDRELLAIVLHSDDTDTRFSEAAALLDYGFSAVPVK